MTRYRTIVADPPWHYSGQWPLGALGKADAVRNGDAVDYRRASAIPYPTMSVEEISALPVADLAGAQAHLYLWTTNKYLPESFAVVSAWGFRYSQTLIWAKTPMGIGPGGTWSQSTEYVLFCRRGVLNTAKRWDSTWFNWPRMGKAHSRKPEAFLDMVEATSPGPYLELFARRQRLGWDTWGNEALDHTNGALGQEAEPQHAAGVPERDTPEDGRVVRGGGAA